MDRRKDQITPKFLLQAFLSFFKIGAFTIGGGYAMVPLIQEEIVHKRGWVSKEDFLDLLALSQSLPGILAVNIAIYTGHKIGSFRCSMVTALGTALPSFLMIIIIAMFFDGIEGNAIVEHIFKGIRPAVVALIAVPSLQLGKSCGINLRNLWIPVAATLAIYVFGISPIWVIIVAGLGGIAYGYHNLNRSRKEGVV